MVNANLLPHKRQFTAVPILTNNIEWSLLVRYKANSADPIHKLPLLLAEIKTSTRMTIQTHH